MSETTGDQILLAELERRKNDIIRVHNPTMDEYVLEYDKVRTNTAWVFPAANTDQFGAGRGNRDVPFYIAEMFRNKMTDKCIVRDAHKKWKELRKEYSKTEQTAWEEERLIAPMLQDKALREEWAKKIIVGLVKRHGDNIGTAPSNKKKSSEERLLELYGSPVEKGLEDLSEEVQSAD